MIDLNEFQSVTGQRNGRINPHITIDDNVCRFSVGAEGAHELRKHFGATANIMVNADYSMILILRGDEKRLSSTSNSYAITSLRDALKEKFGANISRIYFKPGRWEAVSDGTRAYVFEANGNVERHADITYRTLKS